MSDLQPKLLVFSSLFPSVVQPNAGLFVRERMFRVGKKLPVTVISPVPWFPLQSLIRLFRPGYRPMPPKQESQQGVRVYYPRFFSLPVIGRRFDGFFMALGARRLAAKLRDQQAVNLIDAHFAYPDGYAAAQLGKWLNLPVTITLRGTEVPHSRDRIRRQKMLLALKGAVRVFAVANSLKQHMVRLGADAEKIRVVGNGVDTTKFQPIPQSEARKALGLGEEAKVLISVGGLTERKGFHRVIECLPELKKNHPQLMLIIVGGASGEGDWSEKLKQMVAQAGLSDVVRFMGILPPDELSQPLSAADVFVLATSNEGWANVFLEAMACGLPVVTTDVGGNAEVVNKDWLGSIVPFGDKARLTAAIDTALRKNWDRGAIRNYACANEWDTRVQILEKEFRVIANTFHGGASSNADSVNLLGVERKDRMKAPHPGAPGDDHQNTVNKL